LSIGRINSLTNSSTVRPLRGCALWASVSKAASTAAAVAAETRPSLALRCLAGPAGFDCSASGYSARAKGACRGIPPSSAIFASVSSLRISDTVLADAAVRAARVAGGGIAAGAAPRNGRGSPASVGALSCAGSSLAMIWRMEARISSIEGS